MSANCRHDGRQAGTSRLLIVEDDRDMAETYEIWLAERDDVLPAVVRNGRQALERDLERVDGLVLDRQLPDLSGPEVLDRIDTRDVAVVVVSAYEPDAHLAERDVDTYLTKPVSRSGFLSALDAAFSKTE